MKFPYTVTETNITVFADGQMIQVPKTHIGFKSLAEHLQGDEHDAEKIKTLADKKQAITRMTAGSVTVMGSTVYYKGAPVRSALSDRLVKLTDAGFDASPWALFMDKVMQNPSENSKERLFEFLDRWQAPLTPDGNFLAFKGVNEDYSSTRRDPNGDKVYNRPGDTVEMPREEVEEDPTKTCSSGLHACASHYLDSYWKNYKVIAVEIDPADVVSIPIDYNLSKMRVCRYTVIGDIEDMRHRDRIENSQVVDTDSDGAVVGLEPQPLVLNQEQRVQEQHTDADGDRWVEVDTAIEEGGYVVNTSTGQVGKVIEEFEVSYDDEEHPEHDEWADGDIAGSEIADVIYIEVDYLDGTRGHGTYNPNLPPATYDFLPVELVEDEDEDDGYNGEYCLDCGVDLYEDGVQCEDCREIEESGDEPEAELTFEHEATGRTFTDAQIISEVTARGQRGFARHYNVPRTTLQDWLRRIKEAE